MAGKALHDHTGKRSAMRMLTAFTVVTIVSTWAITSILTKTLQPIDPTLGVIVVGSLGAKAGQSWIEHKNNNNGQ